MDDFSQNDRSAIEAETQRVGRYLFDHLRIGRPSMFDRRWWDDRVMGWAMQDESVKVQMFRFVDVLPMLNTREEIVRHLQEYFHDVKRHLPGAVRLGMAAASPRSVLGRALAVAARRNVIGQARRFIAGANVEEVLATAWRQRRLRRAFTLDILGEAVTSCAEADQFLAAYIDLIENVAPKVNEWPHDELCDVGSDGSLPRMNLSVKLSALDARFDSIDIEGTIERVGPRLRQLFRAAQAHDAFINIDMESYASKNLVLQIFKRVLMEDEFRQTSNVGIVIQAYLKEAERDLMALADWAKQRAAPVWVRLVKGAYWDYETVHASAENWSVPVFQRKSKTDENFERLTRFLIRKHQYLRPALGSHNIRSLAHGIAVARHIGQPERALELQMLYGMGDSEKQALVDLGYRMRIYMPYGELIPGMAYLVRRLLENTSNDSFLRASFNESVPPEKLLMNPHDALQAEEAEAQPKRKSASSMAIESNPFEATFSNEPLTDFSQESNCQEMREALARVKDEIGQHWPVVIGGKKIKTDRTIDSVNPSHKSQIVGQVAAADEAHAEQAVAAARNAAEDWWRIGTPRRTEYLRAAADLMRKRRFDLAAWQIYECGKPWREADADVCEAIDFCRFYADCAEAMEAPEGVDIPGEENRFEFFPRGVAAVIAPWNFPLAILAGMTVAALVTGNTVVMKPAEQSSVVAAWLMEIFREIRLPPSVVNFLPGFGAEAGAALVTHPDVALIAFTGSREVGLSINAQAAIASQSGTTHVKKVIAEMGGKNALIVDDDADLDEAVLGTLHSAFGYQGQKCSACSRLLVLDRVYDTFLPRLIEATRSLKVGFAEEPGTDIGPMIDADAMAKAQRYVEIGRKEGREQIAYDVGSLAEEGFFVGPHIFSDIPPDGCLAQDEVFGPVLAVTRVRDLDEAIRLANGTAYALTAGIYSRSPRNIERARDEVLVGNFYINRPITGAIVARQPFGGFRLSGSGSKAGGTDYLRQFVVPRTITENTMRRGFAPSSS